MAQAGKTPLFDRGRLRLLPLSERDHDLTLAVVADLAPVPPEHIPPAILETGKRMVEAKRSGASVIWMMGAHVLRSGVQRYIINLMEQGFITCLAVNGAVLIHDFEFALIGATTESVARYIADGRFGLWQETGRINDIVNGAYKKAPCEAGLAEAVGQAIQDGGFPHKDISVLAAAVRCGVCATAHVGIGSDILHEHPNCDGAAVGALSYNDFLRFASVVENLSKGVVLNFGSAVMAPEVFLKALAMARNVAARQGRSVTGFASLVCDLRDLPTDLSREPPKTCPEYFFRPLKTMLVRTLADGGAGYYARGPHAQTVPALWSAVRAAERA